MRSFRNKNRRTQLTNCSRFISFGRLAVISIALLLGIVSCTTIAPLPPIIPVDTTKSVNSTPIGGISPALSATPIPSSEPEEWTTFSNPKYKFSIAYPSRFEIVQYSETGDAFYLDQQIYISISRFDPLACRGGCPVAENTQPAIIAGLETTKITGYIGAMMAIPQRYITYTLQRGGQHYSITLYALRNDALATDPKNKCCNYVWPMKEDDVVLFEKILATFKFTN